MRMKDLEQKLGGLCKRGKLEQVEITPSCFLKTYLDKTLSTDGQMTEFSYQWTARLLHRLAFVDFKDID